jgi:3alpha(or 20beta)-hydroxysteroid dehydrogenase
MRGIAVLKSIVELSKEEFDRVLAVNLAGTFMGLKYGGQAMIAGGGGSIINISSSAGVIGNNAMGAYSASKFGIRGLAKVAALEMGRAGVRVNTIMPGPVDTGLTNPDGASREMLDRVGVLVTGVQKVPLRNSLKLFK